MKYTLNIYHNGELVNTFTKEDDEAVLREYAKCQVARSVRNVKTSEKPLPYQDVIKLVQKWNTESLGDYRYEYRFEGLKEL